MILTNNNNVYSSFSTWLLSCYFDAFQMIFVDLWRGAQASELLNIAFQVDSHFFRRPVKSKKWDGNMLLARSTKLPGRLPDILAPHIPANTGARCCKKSFDERQVKFIFLQGRPEQGTWQLRVTLDSIRNSSSRTIWSWPVGRLSSCESDQTRPETSIWRT